jgi:hypothetical protein
LVDCESRVEMDRHCGAFFIFFSMCSVRKKKRSAFQGV